MSKYIGGFSGGIDSQAAARVMIDRHGPESIVLVNSDAGGWEDPLTTEHIAWYSANVHPVISVQPILADRLEVFDVTRFLAAVFLSNINNFYMALGICANDDIPESEVKEKCHEAISGLAESLAESGFDRLASEASRLDKSIEYHSAIQIMPLMLAFRENLLHEFGASLFLRVPPEKKQFFLGSQFTLASASSFIKANKDMAAASRCIALDEFDATVFHCMKILEIGLCVVAAHFNVRHVHENWQNIINNIEGRIKGICEKTHGAEWKKEEQFFSEVAVHFQFVKSAWRNYVMHSYDHYDHREAAAIFMHVAEFMDKLAPRFPTEAV